MNEADQTLTRQLAALRDADPSRRWLAAEALEKLGPERPRAVVEALAGAVNDSDLDVRLRVVAALRAMGPAGVRAVAALERALGDHDSDLRRQAAVALGEVGSAAEEAASTLGLALNDPNSNGRLIAAGALEAIGADAQAAAEAVVKALDDKIPSVRRAAARTLGVFAPALESRKMGPVLTGLTTSLRDADLEVRLRSAASLGFVGAQAGPAPEVTAVLAALGEASRTGEEQLRDEAAQALARLGLAGVPELLRNLTAQNVSVRIRAAQSLDQQGAAAVVFGPLFEAIHDAHTAVRAAALQSLLRLDLPTGNLLRVLLEAVKDADSAIRQTAVQNLRRSPLVEATSDRERIEKALLRALDDPQSAVRLEAVGTLSRFGTKMASQAVTGSLLALVKGADETLRLQAALALAQVDPQAARQAVPTLLAALDRGDVRSQRSAGGVDYNVVRALSTLGFAEPLLEAARDGSNERIREGALQALKGMGPRAHAVLGDLVAGLKHKDSNFRQGCAEVLRGVLGTPKEALPVLSETQRTGDADARQWAARFLAELALRDTGPRTDKALEEALPSLVESLLRIYRRGWGNDLRGQALKALSALAAFAGEERVAALDAQVVPALAAALSSNRPGFGTRLASFVAPASLLAAVKESRDDLADLALDAANTLAEARRGEGEISNLLPLVVNQLHRGDPWHRDAAAVLGALRQVGPLTDLLREKYQDATEPRKTGACVALAALGPAARDAVPTLALILRVKGCHPREQAALALAAIGRSAEAAVPALMLSLKDTDAVIPPAALRALTAIGPGAEAAVGALLEVSPTHDDQVRDALRAIAPGGVKALGEALASRDRGVVELAAWALQERGTRARAAAPLLLQAFEKADDSGAKLNLASALVAVGGGDQNALPALALVVANTDDDALREQALKALGAGLDAAVAVPALAAALKRCSDDRAPAVLHVLQGLGHNASAAVGDLADALDRTPLHRMLAETLRAVVAPAASAEEASEALRKAGLDDREMILTLLAWAGQGAAAFVLPALRHRSARVRLAAAQTLAGAGPHGPQERQALTEALSDPNAAVRRAVVAALGAGAESMEALTRATEDLDSGVATLAAELLWQVGLTGDPDSAPAGAWQRAEAILLRPPFLACLTTALRELQRRGTEISPAAVPHLAGALSDGRTSDRTLIVRTLGKLGAGSSAAVPALLGLLQDGDNSLRQEAALALWQIDPNRGESILPVLEQALAEGRLTESGEEALAALGARAEPALRTALTAEAASVRVDALNVVRRMTGVSPVLLDRRGQLLIDVDATVRARAAELLRRPEATSVAADVPPLLAALLRDRTADVRRQAVLAVAAYGRPEKKIVTRMLRLLEDGSSDVRAAAAEALGMGGEAGRAGVSALVHAAKDDSAQVRAEAIRSLGRLGEEVTEAVEGLVTVLADRDPSVRLLGVRALASLGPKAAKGIEALKAAGQDEAEDVRAAAATALASVSKSA